MITLLWAALFFLGAMTILVGAIGGVLTEILRLVRKIEERLPRD